MQMKSELAYYQSLQKSGIKSNMVQKVMWLTSVLLSFSQPLPFYSWDWTHLLLQIHSPCPPQRMSSELSKKAEHNNLLPVKIYVIAPVDKQDITDKLQLKKYKLSW